MKRPVDRLPALFFALGLVGCGPEEACPGGVDEDGNCAAASGTGGQGTGAEEDAEAEASAGTQTDGDSATGPDPGTAAGNNSACMSNGSFPSGISDDPSLRKVIPYMVIGGSASLELGAMTVSRKSATSSGFTWTHVPVTNISDSAWCFVMIEDLSFSDGELELVDDGDVFVEGSVGDLGNGLYTGTCLAAGESGYFLSITEVDFERISEASFSIEEPDTSPATPLEVVVPTGYVVDGSDAEITIEHLSGQEITASDTAVWLLRDSSGEPVVWGFAEASDELVLSPGDTHQYRMSESFLQQVGPNICVWVDFDPPTAEKEVVPPAACEPGQDPERCEKQRWDARTARRAAVRRYVR